MSTSISGTDGITFPDTSEQNSAGLPENNVVGLVANGAVIESGPTANGHYTKFADGTLIEVASFTEAVTATTNVQKDFEVDFIDVPSCNWWWYGSGFTTLGVNFQAAENATRAIINFATTKTAVFGFTAVGRWKV